MALMVDQRTSFFFGAQHSCFVCGLPCSRFLRHSPTNGIHHSLPSPVDESGYLDNEGKNRKIASPAEALLVASRKPLDDCLGAHVLLDTLQCGDARGLGSSSLGRLAAPVLIGPRRFAAPPCSRRCTARLVGHSARESEAVSGHAGSSVQGSLCIAKNGPRYSAKPFSVRH